MPISIFVIIMIIVSYLIGCFSTARLIAKHFKQLNIYKVGTGHPDTENIYQNVSKSLGFLAGVVDLVKMNLYLHILASFYNRIGLVGLDYKVLLLVTGFAMIIGHCLPITNKFIGGRGLFTFIGYGAFFVFEPMLIVSFLAIFVIIFFKQIRFAQYLIVLLPPFVSNFFPAYNYLFLYLLGASILMGIMNFVVSKRLGEI